MWEHHERLLEISLICGQQTPRRLQFSELFENNLKFFDYPLSKQPLKC